MTGSHRNHATKAAAVLSIAAAAIVVLLLIVAPPESARPPAGERKPGPFVSKADAPSAAAAEPNAEHAPPLGDIFEPSAVTEPAGPSAELAALESLIGMGEAGIPALSEVLTDSSASEMEKLRAARALAAIGSHEALQALFDGIFAEGDTSVREILVSALDSFGETGTLDSLVSLLTQPADPAIHAAVIDTVSRMAQAQTIEYLGQLCQETTAAADENSPVLAALSAIRNEEAIPALGVLLSRAEAAPAARAAAAISLAKMGTKQSLTLLASAEASSPGEHSLHALASVQDPAAVPHLKALLEVPRSPGVAQAVAHSLRTIETVHAPLY